MRHLSVFALIIVSIMEMTGAGGEEAAPLVVADKGRATAFILTPAKPSSVEAYAADQMAKALHKMTGAEFRIVNETAKARSLSQPVISIGRTSLAKGLSMQGPAWKRNNPEAYRILRRGNALIICGNQASATPDQGTMYGVYSFLRMQGVGSYMGGEPLGVVYPDKPAIAVRELDITGAPWFEMRGHDDTIDNYLKRAGETRGDLIGFDLVGAFHRMEFNHSFQYIATPQVRKDHPEWFAGTHNSPYGAQPGESPSLGFGLSNNGICLSRPEIRNLFIEYYRKRFRENPDLRVATICPDDYTLGYRCDCPKCTRLINMGHPLPPEQLQSSAPPGLPPQRSSSDLLIDFANAVAKGLEKEFPDRKLITYSYLDYVDPPTTIRVHPNVIIMPVGYWDNSTPKKDSIVRGWQAMGTERLYWYGWMLTRPPIPHLLGEWYRNFKRLGIRGVYMEFSSVPTTNMINAWLVQQLAWDPDADVGRLLDDYFFGLFGPEAGLQMRRFFVAAWETNPPAYDSIPGLLATAEKMAGDPDSVVSKRVRFFKLSWELYHSADELDEALKSADIPRASRIVKSGIQTADALKQDYPWAIKSDIWLRNTAHMEYSVTILPALEALMNTKVAKPAAEAPASGPLFCLTNNAAIPQEERMDTGVTVSFSTEIAEDSSYKKLFDGKTEENSVRPSQPLPGFWITMDFGKEYQIDNLEVCSGMTKATHWETVPIYIETQISNDGTNFAPVDRILPRTLKGFARSGHLSLSARYVRLWITSLNMGQDINEIRVWGRAMAGDIKHD